MDTICVTNAKLLSKPEVAVILKTMKTPKSNVRGRKATAIYSTQFLA